MDLVSVVIPVYNIEGFLPECLESVVQQSYKNLEILLVNDGSTDRSRMICQEYCNSDTRIRIIDQNNAGVSAARNTGIKEARGKYITFVDGDDVIHRDLVFFLVKGAEEAPEAAVSVCRLTKFSNEFLFEAEVGKLEGRMLFGSAALIELLYQRIVNAPFAKLFETSRIKDIAFPVGVKIGEDLLFNIEAFRQKITVVEVQSGLYGYRIRPGSAIGKSTYSDRMLLINKLEELLKDENNSLELNKAIQGRMFSELIYLSIGVQRFGLPNEEMEQVYERIRKARKTVLLNSQTPMLMRFCAVLSVIHLSLPKGFFRVYACLGGLRRKLVTRQSLK